jgi:outer membrane protein assembly factor BamB
MLGLTAAGAQTGARKKPQEKKAVTSAPSKPAPQDLSWRHWGGPNRDFKPPSQGLADKWPQGGPRRLWSRDLGDGYSAIAEENGVLYTTYRLPARMWELWKSDQDVIVALDARTGKTLWENVYEAPFKNANSERVGPGPYVMPQVIGDSLFVASGTGKFQALDKKTGKVLWSHDLYEEFKGTRLEFGYSCHALPYKNMVIMLVGGQGNAIVAFNQPDGAVVWKKQSFKNAHSSPVLINVDGQDQVVALTANEVLGVDPANGELLWTYRHKTQYGLAIATPVWGEGNLLFVSSAYNTGSRVLQLSRSGGRTDVTQLWYTPKVYIHFGTILRLGDTIYGSSGHNGPSFVTAVDVKSGNVLWQSRDFAKAHLIAADGKLIVLDEDGNLGLATASPQGFQVISKVPLLTQLSWTPPTLVGRTLYVRDRRVIMALDLGS